MKARVCTDEQKQSAQVAGDTHNEVKETLKEGRRELVPVRR